MTDTELSGRDLDEACAVALGWTNDAQGWWSFKRKHSRWPRPWKYSEDVSTLNEKMAWLSERGRLSFSQQHWGGRVEWHVELWSGDEVDLCRYKVELNAATIHEATARLCVKVAAALRGAK